MLKKRNDSKKQHQSSHTNSKPNPKELLDRLTGEVESKGVAFFEPKKNLNIDENHL